MIIRWIIRILWAYPFAYAVVNWRKIIRFFKDWGYKDRSVDEIVAEFEKPKKEDKKATVVETVANSNFKTVGEVIPSTYETYAVTRSLYVSSMLLSNMMSNAVQHQKRLNDLDAQVGASIVDAISGAKNINERKK